MFNVPIYWLYVLSQWKCVWQSSPSSLCIVVKTRSPCAAPDGHHSTLLSLVLWTFHLDKFNHFQRLASVLLLCLWFSAIVISFMNQNNRMILLLPLSGTVPGTRVMEISNSSSSTSHDVIIRRRSTPTSEALMNVTHALHEHLLII
jgi:hypothetical protein